MKNNLKWYLVTIEPNSGSSGDAVFNVITLLTKLVNYKFVIINDIEGSPKIRGERLVFHLQQVENRILHLEDLLKTLPNVFQFDWGNFFLFEESPISWKGGKNVPYPEMTNL